LDLKNERYSIVVDLSLTKLFADETTAPVLDPGARTINHKNASLLERLRIGVGF